MISSSEKTKEWCCGLPLVSERPLEAEQEAEIRRLQAACRRRRLILNYGYVGLLIALPAIAFIPLPLFGVLAGGLAIIAFVLLPLKIVLTRDCARRGRALRKDVLAGKVKTFSGMPIRNREDNAPGNDEAVARTLDVLSGSGLLWSSQGKRVPGWVFLESVQVSTLPPASTTAKAWVRDMEPIDSNGGPPPVRELTESEKQELARFARKLWLRPLPVAVGVTLWFSLPLTLSLTGHSAPKVSDQFQFAFLGAVTILADFATVSLINQSRKLNKDRAQGIVFLLRESPGVPAPPNAKVAEVLPNSKWLWSVDDAPSSWRTFAQSR